MGFHECLAIGHKYEEKYIEIMKPTKYKRMEGNFSPYDMIFYEGNVQTKIEIKTDFITPYSGNICIEFRNLWEEKDTGISITEADIWGVFAVRRDGTFDLYNIPVKSIKEFIVSKMYHRITAGGDKNRFMLYLFDINLFSLFIEK